MLGGIGQPKIEILIFSVERITSITGIMTALIPISTTDRFWRNRYKGTCRLCSMLCELLKIGSSKIGKILVGIGMVAASLSLLFIVKFQPDGFAIIWRYFAWSNQILVVFTLAVATSWCVKHDKNILFTVIPGAFYLYVVSSFILNAKVGFNLSWDMSYLISGLLSLAFIAFFSYKKLSKKKSL